MSRRFRIWLAALTVLDVVCWALTIKTAADYHATGEDPRVMTLGQFMGWLVSIALLFVVATMANVWRRKHRGIVPRRRY